MIFALATGAFIVLRAMWIGRREERMAAKSGHGAEQNLIMARYRKILSAVDGSISSMHALRESFKFASNEKCWITVTSVVPSYVGDLDMVGVGNVMGAMRKPCEDGTERG